MVTTENRRRLRMLRNISMCALLASVACAVWAGPVAETKSQDTKTLVTKNVTIVSAEASADGKSQIGKEIVEECIVSLPQASELAPLVEAHSLYLKDINGKPGDNRYVKTYTAKVEINYLLRQKELIIITTNSVPASEPVIKEVSRTVRAF
jgi:hypothetical protein